MKTSGFEEGKKAQRQAEESVAFFFFQEQGTQRTRLSGKRIANAELLMAKREGRNTL